MEMSPTEICQDYRQAKDKNKQIEILADLNTCKPQDILNILSEVGEISGIPAKRSKSKPLSADVVNDMIKLFEQGYSNTEVAEKLGLTFTQVTKKKYDLKKKGYLFDTSPTMRQTEKPIEKTIACSEPTITPADKSSTSSMLNLLNVLVSMQGQNIVSISVKLADDQGKLCHLQMRMVKNYG